VGKAVSQSEGILSPWKELEPDAREGWGRKKGASMSAEKKGFFLLRRKKAPKKRETPRGLKRGTRWGSQEAGKEKKKVI